MDVSQHIEPFSGGLVTNRSAHLLQPGELTIANGCSYRFDDLALRPADGRLQVLSGIADYEFNGLEFLQFDDGTAFLAFQDTAASTLRIHEIGTNASNTTVSTYSTSTDGLDAVEFRNQYFIFNGSHVNRVVSHTGGVAATAPTVVQHGLTEVTEKLTISMTTGTWPLGDSGLDQWYEYWYTEVVTLSNGDELESSCAATAVVTTPSIIDSTTDAVALTFNGVLANSAASAIRIYRSNGKTYQTDTAFPTGIRIGQINVTNSPASFTDGGQTASSLTTGTAAQSTNTYSYAWLGAGTADASQVAWSGTSNTASNNNTYDTAALTVGTPFTNVRISQFYTTTITFTGLTDPVNGITVQVDAKTSSADTSSLFATLACEISQDGGTTWQRKGVPITASDPASPYSLGGANDNWGLTLSAAQLMSNGLKVRLWAALVQTSGTGSASRTVSLDYVAAQVHYAGASASSSVPFPAVILNINGDTASVPANAKPATASTGCVLNDMLLTNDINNPSFLRWCLPGSPHYQPRIYFDDIETPRNDAVTCIRALNGRGIAGMETQLWRVNYLPTEDDASFSRGEFREPIDSHFGIVGRKAACTFVGPDGRELLAFVSLDGLRATDGFSSWSLCDDLDWRTMLSPSTMVSRVKLVNNPRNHSLLLYYPNGASVLGKRMEFLYHPLHIKNGKLKAIGPITIGVASPDDSGDGCGGVFCAPSLHTGYSWSVYEAWGRDGNQKSKMWRRVDPGTGSAQTESQLVYTRNMFLAGFGKEWKLKDSYLFGGMDSSSAQTITPYAVLSYTNSAAVTVTDLEAVVASYNPTIFAYHHAADGIKLGFTTSNVNNADYRWDFLAMDVEQAGKEDSR